MDSSNSYFPKIGTKDGKVPIYFAKTPEEAPNRNREQKTKNTTHLARDPKRVMTASFKKYSHLKIDPPPQQHRQVSVANAPKCHPGTQKKSPKM